METLNRQVENLVLEKKLSPRKIRNLIVLKKVVERLATKPYVSADTVAELEQTYGEAPDIITWGDYFQTEVASDHWQKDDEEFETIMQTITFDLIAAVLIFHNKGAEFINFVREQSTEAMVKDREAITDDDREKIHLDVLLGYFQQMGLSKDKLTDQDFAYFEQFASQKAVS